MLHQTNYCRVRQRQHANGEASVQIVKTQDTVYLKEITAPSGYRINATAYNVKLEVSKTTRDEKNPEIIEYSCVITPKVW